MGAKYQQGHIKSQQNIRILETEHRLQLSSRYISLVRPHLEYASSVWDPFRKCHINALEMVQRKAARFATSNYTREPGTVTTILQNLGWQTLENRRKMARLTLLYKSINPPYLTKPTTRTRQYTTLSDSLD